MLQTLEHPTTQKVFRYVVLAAVLLLIVTIGLFLYGRPSFSEKDVVVTLQGPTQALSGDEVTYKLSYANNTGLDLHNLKFRFTYPTDAVVVKDGTPTPATADEFDLADLKSGHSEEKEFTMFLVGDKGNIKEAQVSMLYSAGTLRSDFKATATAQTTITDVPVPLVLVAPPSAVSGQDVTYLLDYRNASQADISDLAFEFNFPDGFVLKSTSPKPSSGTTWSVPLLKQGGGARITIQGTLSGSEREAKNLEVTLKRKVDGQFIDYEKATSSTVISSPLLTTTINVNGSRDYTAVPGDSLQYQISYKNSYNQSLLGLTLSMKLEGDMYDFTTLDPNNGYFDGQTNTIIWNASALPELASLSPGQGGNVKFNIKLQRGLTAANGSRSFSVKATVTLATPNVPSGIDTQDVSTQDSVITKIRTTPTLAQVVYYNDPAFGASGPWPLQSGKETILTVHWQLVNPGNDMANTKIVATLPSGIAWKNVVSVGVGQPQPIYDRNRAQVTWSLGLLPQGTGTTNPKYEGTFQVGVTPSIPQQGSVITLLKNIVLSGNDNFTKQDIVVPLSDVTSSSVADRPGEGVVR